MQLSVVIVNYNVRYFLEQCIISVQDALRGIDGEIIVVDNFSQDYSCQMVKDRFPNVILIENTVNVGFSKANNQGVALAKGKYVLILNPDTVVAEDTFSKILSFAEEQANLGILGVKLIDGLGNFLPESKRGIPTPSVSLGKIIGSSSKYYATHLQENEMGKVDVLVGAFMLLEHSKYLEVKGFDEDYFMFGEDIDLSYKLLKSGYDNYYYPDTQVLHYKGESTLKDSNYLDNFYGAMQIFYQKHFQTNFLYNFLIKIAIKLWRGIHYLKAGSSKIPNNILPKKVLYVGNDNALYENLKKIFSTSEILLFASCTTRVISRYDDLDKLSTMIRDEHIDEIVFDNDANSFSKILFYMQSLKNKNIIFNIHPKHTNFIVAGSSSTDKGRIIKLM